MKKIDAVQMVRDIRDRQSKEIQGKSPQEIVEYFHKKAATIDKTSKTAGLNKH